MKLTANAIADGMAIKGKFQAFFLEGGQVVIKEEKEAKTCDLPTQKSSKHHMKTETLYIPNINVEISEEVSGIGSRSYNI